MTLPQQPSSPRYLVIAGPTASGKSALGLTLAQALQGAIVNCDSVQVYAGFDIGSAKARATEQAAVPHALLSTRSALEPYDAGLFAAEAAKAIADFHSRSLLPIVVGGTGLYLRALLGQGWHQDLPKDESLRTTLNADATPVLWAKLQALDPQRAAELHANDRVRILRSLELNLLLGQTLSAAGLTAAQQRNPAAFVIALDPPRPVLRGRIAARTEQMLAAGLVDEVKTLLNSGISPDAKPMQSIGYKQVVMMLRGELSPLSLAAAITTASQQYAKRQCTWFRKLDADLRLTSAEDLATVLAQLPFKTPAKYIGRD